MSREWMPSIIGLDHNKISWHQRQKNGQGFARTSRPSTANASSTRGINGVPKEYDFSLLAKTSDALTRPTSSNGLRPSSIFKEESSLRAQKKLNSFLRSNQGSQAQYDVLIGDEEEPMVCRFSGYFIETRQFDVESPLGQPNVEAEYIHQMTINFYVRDGTVEVFETKVKNSGYAGGKFFVRNVLTKPNGARLTLLDLLPGGQVDMVGQTFFIKDADQRTKDYISRVYDISITPTVGNVEMIDPSMTSIHDGAQLATGMGGVYKSFLPSMSMPSILANQRNNNPNFGSSYHSNYPGVDEDSIILNFQCIDVPLVTTRVNGRTITVPKPPILDTTLKRLNLAFDTAEKTIEIRGLRSDFENKRNDEAPRLFKKIKVPKNWREVQRGNFPIYFTAKDFICGQMVEIYGRQILLLKCDSKSQAYYESYGINQVVVPLIKKEEQVIHSIPQLGDGFLPIGSQEDSMGNVYGYIKPNKNTQLNIRNKGRSLKCKAIMLTSFKSYESNSIIFEICYYLEDDTVRVYEKGDKRSGQHGVVYLMRGKYLNALPYDTDKPRLFIPTDIYLGNVISINRNEMRIIEVEEGSSLFCESYPKEFPYFDAYRIITIMIDKMVENKIDIRAAFQVKDAQKSDLLTRDEFVAVFDSLGISSDLNDQEIMTILRKHHLQPEHNSTTITTNTNGNSNMNDKQYNYLEFCDMCSYLFAVKYVHGTLPQSDLLRRLRVAHKRWRRSISRYSGVKDYISLESLVKLCKKHEFYLSEMDKQELIQVFVVSREHAMSQRLLTTTNTSLSKTNVEGKKAADAMFRVDDDFVQKRRKELVKSTLNRNLTKPSTAPILSPTSGSTNLGGASDLSRVIISYTDLCDAIYQLDWLLYY